ncbi:MAG: hypothetical protein HC802_14035 [Caldilineaceae bacterium]|nr:hypothetical protein [Caldilineaceae bacterium]
MSYGPLSSNEQPDGFPPDFTASQAQAWMRRFFRAEGSYLDWLQEPTAYLIEARDSTLGIDARLGALSQLFAALDRAHTKLAALQNEELIDASLREELQLVLPAYAEELLSSADALWQEELATALVNRGLHPRHVNDLPEPQIQALRDYFMRRIYPLLTPLAVDPGHPFPFISSGSANLLVQLSEVHSSVGNDRHQLYARVKVPTTSPILIDRQRPAVAMPMLNEPGPSEIGLPLDFVWCGETVRHFIQTLFTGMNISSVHFFRLLRAGPATAGAAQSIVRPRGRSTLRDTPVAPVVRLDVERSAPLSVVEWLSKHVGVPAHGIVRSDLILELACLPQLVARVCHSPGADETTHG